MNFREYGLFLVAALAVIIAPGPDIFYVLSRAVSSGRRIGCIAAFGIAWGEVVHTILAILGLAALIQTSALAFIVLKYVGGAYLIYLGLRALHEPSQIALETFALASGRKAFRQGVLTNLFNPKAVLFFVTFLPQFVNPSSGHVQLQLALLGLTFAVLDVIALVALAFAAGTVHSWLARKPKTAKCVRVGTGSILVGLGIRLALTERN